MLCRRLCCNCRKTFTPNAIACCPRCGSSFSTTVGVVLLCSLVVMLAGWKSLEIVGPFVAYLLDRSR